MMKECQHCFALYDSDDDDDGESTVENDDTTAINICRQCKADSNFQDEFLSGLWELSKLKEKEAR